MFDRRNKRTRLQNTRETFWPSMGWKRTFHYTKHRIHRLPGSAYSIAAGLACGMCVSFTPPLATHFLLAMGWAWIIKGNIIASLIGTAFGNPLTFPIFIWPLSFNIGKALLLSFGYDQYAHIPIELSIDFILDNLIIFTVGGFACAFVFWPVFFIPLYFLIQSAKLARAKRMSYLRHKREKQHKGEAGGPLIQKCCNKNRNEENNKQ